MFNWLKGKKDPNKLQFRRNLAISESVESARRSNPEAEYLQTIGKMGYMVMDERVIDLLFSNPSLQSLGPVYSPVNATIRLSKQEAALKRIRIENHITMLKLTMHPDLYEGNGMEILEGLRLFGFDRVSEAEAGWKGHLVTEQVKKIEISTDKNEKL